MKPGYLSRYSDGLRAEQPWLDYRQKHEIFLYSTASKPVLWHTQPPFLWVPGALFPGVKRPGHEAEHSSPSSAEVSNGSAIPLLPTSLHGAVFN
jgi:hypothetical protein